MVIGKEITKKLKPVFEKITTDLNIYNWYYSWTFLYGNALSKKRTLFYDTIDNSLCIYFEIGNKRRLFYPPLNGNDVTLYDVAGSKLQHFATRRFLLRHLEFDILVHTDELPENHYSW